MECSTLNRQSRLLPQRPDIRAAKVINWTLRKFFIECSLLIVLPRGRSFYASAARLRFHAAKTLTGHSANVQLNGPAAVEQNEKAQGSRGSWCCRSPLHKPTKRVLARGSAGIA